jgi:hypothetical protein
VFEALGGFLFQRQEEGHDQPYVRRVHVVVEMEVDTTGDGDGAGEAADDAPRKRARPLMSTEDDGDGAHDLDHDRADRSDTAFETQGRPHETGAGADAGAISSAAPPPRHAFQYILLRSSLDVKIAHAFLSERRRSLSKSRSRSRSTKKGPKNTPLALRRELGADQHDDNNDDDDDAKEAAAQLHVSNTVSLWAVRDLQFVFEQVQGQQHQQKIQQQQKQHQQKETPTPGQDQDQEQKQEQLGLHVLDWTAIATKFNARNTATEAGSAATASHAHAHMFTHDNNAYFLCPPQHKKEALQAYNLSKQNHTPPNTSLLLQLHTTTPQVQAVFEALGGFLFQRQEEGHDQPYVRRVHVVVEMEVDTTGDGAGEAADDASRKRARPIMTTEDDGDGAHAHDHDRADRSDTAKKVKITSTNITAEGQSESAVAAATATPTVKTEMEIMIAKDKQERKRQKQRTLEKKRLQRQHVILVKHIMTAFAKQCLSSQEHGEHPLKDLIGTFRHSQAEAEAEAAEGKRNSNKCKEKQDSTLFLSSNNANATCIADFFWTRLLQDLHVQEHPPNAASASGDPPLAEEEEKDKDAADFETDATANAVATITTHKEKESTAPAAKDKNVHPETDATVAATITTQEEKESMSAPTQTRRDTGITTGLDMDTDTLKALFYDSVITADFFMKQDEDDRAQVIVTASGTAKSRDTTKATDTSILIVVDQETEDAAAAMATCHAVTQGNDQVGTSTATGVSALATLSNTGDKVKVDDDDNCHCFPQWRIGFLLRELLVQWQHRFDHNKDNEKDDHESNTFWNHCSSSIIDGWNWVALAKVVSVGSVSGSPLGSGRHVKGLHATNTSTITPFDLKAHVVNDTSLLKCMQHIREHCFAATSARQDALVARILREAKKKERKQMKVRHHPWTLLELGVFFRELMEHGHHKYVWASCLKAFPAEFQTKEGVLESSTVKSVTKDKAKYNTMQHLQHSRLRYEMKMKAEKAYWLRDPFEPWSEAETCLVMEKLLQHGKDWIHISEHLMGRSAFDVQRYYETYKLPEEDESKLTTMPLIIQPTGNNIVRCHHHGHDNNESSSTSTSILASTEREADIVEAAPLEDAEADVDVDTEAPPVDQTQAQTDGSSTSVHNKDTDMMETEALLVDAEAPQEDQDAAGTGVSVHNKDKEGCNNNLDFSDDLPCNWTVAEHVVLLRDLDPAHRSKWVKVAKVLPRRTPKEVEDYVMGDHFVFMPKVKEAKANANQSVVGSSKKDENTVSGKQRTTWTQEETEMLMQHVFILGRNAWDQVAEALPRRTPREARSRFYKFRLGESFFSDDDSCTGKSVAVAGDIGDDSDRTNSCDEDDASAEREEVHDWKTMADEEKEQGDHFNKFDVFLEATGDKANPDVAIDKEWTDEEIHLLWYKFEEHGKAWKTIKRALPNKTTDQCKFKLDELLKWTIKDDNALIAAHAAYIRSGNNNKTGDDFWTTIVDNADLLPNRGVRELSNRYDDLRNEYLKRTQKRSVGRWTREEKELVAKLVIQHGFNWKKIQTHLPGRTIQLIKGTFYRLYIGTHEVPRGVFFLPPNHPDDPFSIIEDGIIVREVLKWNFKLTDDYWNKLATLLPGRTVEKIQERYKSHLKAKIPYKKYNLVPWTDDELNILFGTYLKYGPDYNMMHKALKGRTWESVNTQLRCFQFSSPSAKKEEKDDETKDSNDKDNGKDKESETRPWSIVEQGVLMREFSRHGRDWEKIAASLSLLPGSGLPRFSGWEARQQFQLLEPEFAKESSKRASVLRQHLHKIQ